MNNGVKIFLIVAVAAGITYGIITYRKQQALIQDITYDFRNLKGKIHSVSSVEIGGNILIKNDSAFQFHIVSQSLQIYVNNKYIGDVQTAPQITVEKHGNSTIPISLQFNPSDIMPGDLSISGILATRAAIRGDILIRYGLFFARIPVDYSYSLADII